MSLHAELLEQAEHLARRERRRPKQASLRRAVSAAYYSLFHLLIYEFTIQVIRDPDLRPRFSRAFEHGEMKQTSQVFGRPNLSRDQLEKLAGGLTIPPDVQQVAQAFVTLQDARHDADYDLDKTFTAADVRALISKAQQAFQAWQSVRKDPAAKMYLAAMLLGRRREH